MNKDKLQNSLRVNSLKILGREHSLHIVIVVCQKRKNEHESDSERGTVAGNTPKSVARSLWERVLRWASEA